MSHSSSSNSFNGKNIATVFSSSKTYNSNRDLLNQFINKTLLSLSMSTNQEQENRQTILYPAQSLNSSSTSLNTAASSKTGIVADWEYFKPSTKKNGFNSDDDDKKSWIAVAFYSEILLERKDMSFVKHFLNILMKEYALFYDTILSNEDKGLNSHMYLDKTNIELFDKTVQALWKRMEGSIKVKRENNPEQNESQSVENQNRSHQRLPSKSKPSTINSSKKKNEKQKTVWHDGKGKVTKSTLEKLDRSKDANYSSNGLDSIDAAMADDSAALREARAAYLPTSDEIPSWLEEDEFNLDEEEKSTSETSSAWSFQSLFDKMSGNKLLSENDLMQPIDDMKKMLISKNVAQEIATEICSGVMTTLVGKRMFTFSRVKSTAKAALEQSILHILSPHRDIDLLRQVISKRESNISSMFRMTNNNSQNNRSNKPYVIVMVGINGVGKSTSLAKIAYFLKSNGCSPLLAACDTFRSGAVEQLGVHAKCLNIPLFHKGYAKDPSAVAKAAIASATDSKNDCVLIDTAGRMQNNLPLMKALKKLIAENNPDLVLFVGEALVGNDGLNQLQMFDKALSTEGRGDGKHGVDGIILSKFDTVGEKVGAALSMVKFSGKPIVFVGVGQKYGHLKKLSVNSVIKSLFS